jgi:hypothetical protein
LIAIPVPVAAIAFHWINPPDVLAVCMRAIYDLFGPFIVTTSVGSRYRYFFDVLNANLVRSM